MRFTALKLRDILLVGVGGMLGTLARFGVGNLISPSWAATLTVNLLGAFLMGLLVGAIATRGGTDSPRRSAVNALAGTGFLGGFTTYSALATDALALAALYRTTGILFSAGSALVGAIFAAIGFAITYRKRATASTDTQEDAS